MTKGDKCSEQQSEKGKPADTTTATTTTTTTTTTPDLAASLAQTDALDLVFALDCTGSMGTYIQSAQRSIRSMVEEITSTEKADVRFGLVAYRDHPPQDTSFITRVTPLTSSVSKMRKALDRCSASGGGDGPEAVAAALAETLQLDFRENATRVCVLIADAPPHGLPGQCGDGFPNGCPMGHDPVNLAHSMASSGISLYVVGCEPSIQPYKDFYQGLCLITGGQYAPLSGAKGLASLVVGGAREEMGLERLMQSEDAEEVISRVLADGGDEESQARAIQKAFSAKRVTVTSLQRGGGGSALPSDGGGGGCAGGPITASIGAADAASDAAAGSTTTDGHALSSSPDIPSPMARKIAATQSLAEVKDQAKWRVNGDLFSFGRAFVPGAVRSARPHVRGRGRGGGGGGGGRGAATVPASASAKLAAAAAPAPCAYSSVASPVSMEQCLRMVKKKKARA